MLDGNRVLGFYQRLKALETVVEDEHVTITIKGKILPTPPDLEDQPLGSFKMVESDDNTITIVKKRDGYSVATSFTFDEKE